MIILVGSLLASGKAKTYQEAADMEVKQGLAAIAAIRRAGVEFVVFSGLEVGGSFGSVWTPVRIVGSEIHASKCNRWVSPSCLGFLGAFVLRVFLGA
jgi:hypothetical protein